LRLEREPLLLPANQVARLKRQRLNLAAAGFAPEHIDYVLCMHLHADHVGWNTRLVNGRWVPTFPNARYLFAREEWEHWQVAEWRPAYTTDPYYENSLLPVMEGGQAELVAADPTSPFRGEDWKVRYR
jgi:glyoxylase-like metal-dependent hydrolase (beta-lactamase superfamily II)